MKEPDIHDVGDAADEFTALDLHLISACLTGSTDEEIAAILQKPLHLVVAKINEITGMAEQRQADLKSHRLAVLQAESIKRNNRRKQVEVDEGRREMDEKRVKREKQEQAAINRDHAAQLGRQKRLEVRRYKTREIDYSQLRSLRIDSKTTVFLEPGDDEYEVRERYKEIRKKQTNGTHDVED
jgi:hypothetical protein